MVQTWVINRGKLLKKIKLSAAALLDSLFQGVSREFSKAFDDELVAQLSQVLGARVYVE